MSDIGFEAQPCRIPLHQLKAQAAKVQLVFLVGVAFHRMGEIFDLQLSQGNHIIDVAHATLHESKAGHNAPPPFDYARPCNFMALSYRSPLEPGPPFESRHKAGGTASLSFIAETFAMTACKLSQ